MLRPQRFNASSNNLSSPFCIILLEFLFFFQLNVISLTSCPKRFYHWFRNFDSMWLEPMSKHVVFYQSLWVYCIRSHVGVQNIVVVIKATFHSCLTMTYSTSYDYDYELFLQVWKLFVFGNSKLFTTVWKKDIQLYDVSKQAFKKINSLHLWHLEKILWIKNTCRLQQRRG